MEITIEDASGLPEALQALVHESKLDLTKVMPVEDLSGLKSALQKERGNVSAYAKHGTPDEIAEKIADLEAKAKGTGKGAAEAQEKLDALAAEKDAVIAKQEERITNMMQRNASSDLRAELAKAGFIPEAIDDIAASAMARLQFNEDGTPKVMTTDGKPMIGTGADHGATLTDLAAELAKAKPYAVQDSGKGGGGKPPGSDGGKPVQKTVTRAQFDAMSQYDRAEFSKSGGKVKD